LLNHPTVKTLLLRAVTWACRIAAIRGTPGR
jgi:hypothetical protein